jgi:hypothetical protein
MEFIAVAAPDNESELAVMVSLLEASGIRHYVHNQGFGGLYPGLQIGLYNARRIMVAVEQAADASELLSVFHAAPAGPVAGESMTMLDRLRVVIETCLFGWSFPGRRPKFEEPAEDADSALSQPTGEIRP